MYVVCKQEKPGVAVKLQKNLQENLFQFSSGFSETNGRNSNRFTFHLNTFYANFKRQKTRYFLCY